MPAGKSQEAEALETLRAVVRGAGRKVGRFYVALATKRGPVALSFTTTRLDPSGTKTRQCGRELHRSSAIGNRKLWAMGTFEIRPDRSLSFRIDAGTVRPTTLKRALWKDLVDREQTAAKRLGRLLKQASFEATTELDPADDFDADDLEAAQEVEGEDVKSLDVATLQELDLTSEEIFEIFSLRLQVATELDLVQQQVSELPARLPSTTASSAARVPTAQDDTLVDYRASNGPASREALRAAQRSFAQAAPSDRAARDPYQPDPTLHSERVLIEGELHDLDDPALRDPARGYAKKLGSRVGFFHGNRTDFSGYEGGEIYIVGHGSEGGHGAKELLEVFNHPERGLRRDFTGTITLSYCLAGIPSSSSASLVDTVAAGLKLPGVTVRGAKGLAFSTYDEQGDVLEERAVHFEFTTLLRTAGQSPQERIAYLRKELAHLWKRQGLPPDEEAKFFADFVKLCFIDTDLGMIDVSNEAAELMDRHGMLLHEDEAFQEATSAGVADFDTRDEASRTVLLDTLPDEDLLALARQHGVDPTLLSEAPVLEALAGDLVLCKTVLEAYTAYVAAVAQASRVTQARVLAELAALGTNPVSLSQQIEALTGRLAGSHSLADKRGEVATALRAAQAGLDNGLYQPLPALEQELVTLGELLDLQDDLDSLLEQLLQLNDVAIWDRHRDWRTAIADVLRAM